MSSIPFQTMQNEGKVELKRLHKSAHVSSIVTPIQQRTRMVTETKHPVSETKAAKRSAKPKGCKSCLGMRLRASTVPRAWLPNEVRNIPRYLITVRQPIPVPFCSAVLMMMATDDKPSSVSNQTVTQTPHIAEHYPTTNFHENRHVNVRQNAHSGHENHGDVSISTFTSRGPSLLLYLSRYMGMELDTSHADIVLIVCGFVAGLVDGLSFNAWGSFSSMQTGNTVFIALGVSGQPEYPAYLWAKSLIALTVFLLSNVFFIQLSRLLNPLRRSTLVLSFGLQTAAIIVAASLVHAGIVSPRPEDPRAPIEWIQIIPISFLAFQAAGQICASRQLEYDEIPTVVLTTLLCDLLVDPEICARPWSANPKRNRRIAAFLALFLGAMTAGGLSKVASLASSLWLAVALKGSITISWVFWEDLEGSSRPKRGSEDSLA